MKKSKFTEEQISYALRQIEAGTPVLEVCRRLGITEQTFYRWKKKFAGMGVAEPVACASSKTKIASSNNWSLTSLWTNTSFRMCS